MTFKFEIGQHVIHKSEKDTFCPTKLYILGRAVLETEGGVKDNLYLVSYSMRTVNTYGSFARSYIYEQELDHWPDRPGFTE